MKSVLLFNANNNVSLSITRGLGRKGIPVDGVAIGHGGVGMFSRYMSRKFYLEQMEHLSDKKLKKLLCDTKASYIMAMGEEVLSRLNKFRKILPKNVKLLFPDQPILDHAFDKSKTLAYAKRLSIDIPKSYFCRDIKEITELKNRISYPAVLKFAESHLNSIPVNLRFKYRYVFSGHELLKLMERYIALGIYPIIQEYIPGKGVGVELCVYKGRVVGAFQHERIHEYPVTGGVSVYRKSVVLDQDLLNDSVRLLSAMEWEGVAMVEFRRDPINRRSVLMEINGRFWGSLPLAIHAGVNFPYLLYRSMGEGIIDKPSTYKIGVKVQQLSTHFKWFIDACFRRKSLPPEGFMSGGRAVREFISAFSPRVGCDIEQIDDPLPGLNFWAAKMGLRVL